MVHKRSPAAFHRRREKNFVRRLMRAKARRDPEMAETICMTDTATVVDKYYGFREPEISFIDKGDVLNDARGRGVLDKVPLPGKHFVGR